MFSCKKYLFVFMFCLWALPTLLLAQTIGELEKQLKLLQSQLIDLKRTVLYQEGRIEDLETYKKKVEDLETLTKESSDNKAKLEVMENALKELQKKGQILGSDLVSIKEVLQGSILRGKVRCTGSINNEDWQDAIPFGHFISGILVLNCNMANPYAANTSYIVHFSLNDNIRKLEHIGFYQASNSKNYCENLKAKFKWDAKDLGKHKNIQIGSNAELEIYWTFIGQIY